jgi:hypothetical protein
MKKLLKLWENLFHDENSFIIDSCFNSFNVWLVIPSMVLFLILPVLLRRDWEFEYAMAIGITMTIVAYATGIGIAKYFGNVS